MGKPRKESEAIMTKENGEGIVEGEGTPRCKPGANPGGEVSGKLSESLGGRAPWGVESPSSHALNPANPPGISDVGPALPPLRCKPGANDTTSGVTPAGLAVLVAECADCRAISGLCSAHQAHWQRLHAALQGATGAPTHC